MKSIQISDRAKPLHFGIAMALASACTTFVIEAAPRFSWIPSFVISKFPASQSRYARITSALDEAIRSARALRDGLEFELLCLNVAKDIADFDQVSKGLTESLSMYLEKTRAIKLADDTHASMANELVRMIASARSASAGIDVLRGQFEIPARPYVSDIDFLGMQALSKHAWGLSLA